MRQYGKRGGEPPATEAHRVATVSINDSRSQIEIRLGKPDLLERRVFGVAGGTQVGDQVQNLLFGQRVNQPLGHFGER